MAAGGTRASTPDDDQPRQQMTTTAEGHAACSQWQPGLGARGPAWDRVLPGTSPEPPLWVPRKGPEGSACVPGVTRPQAPASQSSRRRAWLPRRQGHGCGALGGSNLQGGP